MAKVEDMANELVLAKEQLKNINATINRDKEVLAGIQKEIDVKKGLAEEADAKIGELTDQIASLNATKESIEKEYGAVRDNLKAEIKKLSDSKKKDEEKYHISVSELSNDVKVLGARKANLEGAIADLESTLDKEIVKVSTEIGVKENELKKVQDKLNDFNVSLAEQQAKFDKTANAIKEMEERLEEKDKIEKAITKAQKKLEEEQGNLANINQEKINVLNQVDDAKAEVKEFERQREALAKECENYIKMKLDIKERNDKLDAREKYLRKRFEEAGVKFD